MNTDFKGNRNPGNQGFGFNREEKIPSFENEFLPEWITTGITNSTVDFADKVGKYLKEIGLTTSQIRNVFGEIKRIQMKGFDNEKPSFYLLRPKMAYASKRHENIKPLKNVFDKAHQAVTNKEQYKNFVDFFEAILAYHKAYGGKD